MNEAPAKFSKLRKSEHRCVAHLYGISLFNFYLSIVVGQATNKGGEIREIYRRKYTRRVERKIYDFFSGNPITIITG